MDIQTLLDYQKFAPQSSLSKLLEQVERKYLSGGVELPDDCLDVSAAGEAVDYRLLFSEGGDHEAT